MPLPLPAAWGRARRWGPLLYTAVWVAYKGSPRVQLPASASQRQRHLVSVCRIPATHLGSISLSLSPSSPSSLPLFLSLFPHILPPYSWTSHPTLLWTPTPCPLQTKPGVIQPLAPRPSGSSVPRGRDSPCSVSALSLRGWGRAKLPSWVELWMGVRNRYG